MLKIHTFPDPVLSSRAAEVTEVTTELRQLAQNMLETMYANKGVGLAAPQVGHSIRLIVVDVTGPDRREEPYVFFNPVILSGQGEVESEEGCLSCPDLTARVVRMEAVALEAQGLDGKITRIVAEDLMAICLQHEIDHLEGTVLVDHVSRLKRSLYMKKARKWTREAAARNGLE